MGNGRAPAVPKREESPLTDPAAFPDETVWSGYGRGYGYVPLLLPVLGLLMGSGVGADPWRVLTTTGTGQVLLVGGVALEAAGLVWSHRLVERALR